MNRVLIKCILLSLSTISYCILKKTIGMEMAIFIMVTSYFIELQLKGE